MNEIQHSSIEFMNPRCRRFCAFGICEQNMNNVFSVQAWSYTVKHHPCQTTSLLASAPNIVFFTLEAHLNTANTSGFTRGTTRGH